jgi:O-antigen/teichoic acid export membrane protein
MKALVQSGLALSRGPIARSSIQSVAIRLTGLAISFAQAVLAARILGAEGYGIAAVGLSVAQVAGTLAVFGLGPLAVRELPREQAAGRPAAIAPFIHRSARPVIVLAVLTGGALSAASLTGLVPEAYRPALLFSGLVVLPYALLQLQRDIARGLGRIAVAQVPIELVRPSLFAGFLLIVALAQAPLGTQTYIAAFALAAAIALALSLPFTLRGIPPGPATPEPAEAKRWRREALPFLGLALTAMMLGEINTLLLGWLSTPHEAGLFQPVARLSPLMSLPVQAAGMRFNPRIAELWELGETERIARLHRTFTWSTTLLTAVAAVLLAGAGPWIMAAFGSDFAASAPLLWIAAAAQVFYAACGPSGVLLAMRGRSLAALAGQAIGLAANVALGAWLIPQYGALGAAIAMAGGIAAWTIAWLLLLHGKRGA